MGITGVERTDNPDYVFVKLAIGKRANPVKRHGGDLAGMRAGLDYIREDT